MKRLFLLLSLLIAMTELGAQRLDTVQSLPEVEIRDVSKPPADNGKVIQHLKPAMLQNTLGALLEGSSAWTIKSYGPGMLAGLSLRGSGAVHSPILWNGLNIQNSMNGQQDLNLIPAFFFDNIALNPGAQNNLNTGGILGGSLTLNSYKPSQNRLIAGFDAGSFSTYAGRLGADITRGRFSNRLRAQVNRAENDFSFYDPHALGRIERRQTNARVESLALLNELRYVGPKKWTLGLSAWWQDVNRQIPPTLLSTSTAYQEDEVLRLNFNAEKSDSVNYYQYNSGYFAEHIWYHDAARSLTGLNHVYTFINQVQYRRSLNKFNVQGGLSHHFFLGGTSSYEPDEVSQQRTAIYLAVNSKWKRLRWKADLRQEFAGVVPAPAWSLGADLALASKSKLSGHLTQVSRLPNLNDLYWNPGGNPDLQPEKGHSAELSYSYFTRTEKSLFDASLTVFYSIIENWILWLPESGYWTAQNLQEVHSRGAEWKFKAARTRDKQGLMVEYGGSFTLASNEKTKSAGDVSVGKQLIYVPYWKNYFRIQGSYRNWQLGYRQVLMGGRYTASDNSSFLPPYATGDIDLRYTYEYKRQRIAIAAGVSNITNTYYESVAQRPMPGRYFQLSIDYQFL